MEEALLEYISGMTEFNTVVAEGVLDTDAAEGTSKCCGTGTCD